jgi:hypothetical protein
MLKSCFPRQRLGTPLKTLACCGRKNELHSLERARRFGQVCWPRCIKQRILRGNDVDRRSDHATLRDQWRNKERRQSFCDRLFPRGRLRDLYLSCREVLGRCACAMPFSVHDRSGIYNGFHFKMVRGIVGETKKC